MRFVGDEGNEVDVLVNDRTPGSAEVFEGRFTVEVSAELFTTMMAAMGWRRA